MLVCLKQILAEVGRLRGCGEGWDWFVHRVLR
jgi:hypothetical protein